MATLVSFHAHPDDEAILTGGTMAKAAADGHRVVLVVATRGEFGEVAPGTLPVGVPLGERRELETRKSARILGVHRVAFLGYIDSGMAGTPTNSWDGAFWRAPVDEATERLTAILREEAADVLTVYDEDGGYGHPDHIQVHRVGVRAAEIAGTDRVYEAVMNRDHIARGIRAMPQGSEIEMPEIDEESAFGVREELISTAVDASSFLEQKRAALAAHATQVTESSIFLGLPKSAFAYAFGTEWYIRRDSVVPSLSEADLFAGLSMTTPA